MEPKNIDQYFESARQLPLAMSIEEVQALVKIKGGNSSSNQNQSWWNLKNFIFMTTAAVIITSAILFMNSSSQQQEQQPLKQEITTIPTNFEKEVETKDVPVNKEQPATSVDDEKQEVLSTLNETEKLIEPQMVVPIGLVEPIALFEGEDLGGILIPDPDPAPPANLFELSEIDINDDNDKVEGSTKTVEKETSVNGAKWLVVNNYKGDITINTSDQENIQLKAYITVSGANEEDTQKALKDLDVNLEHKGNKIEVIKTGWGLFDETCSCPSGNSKGKITTKKGEKIKKYTVDYVITVPKSMSLELKDNYGDIDVKDIEGDVNLNSFQGGITAGNIGGELTLKSRYGKVNIGNFKTGDATLFQSKAKLGEVKELDLDAKYSDVDAIGIEKLELTAFQSDIYMEKKSVKITGNLKYGDLIVENNVKEIDLTVFQAKVEVENVEELEMEGSYTSLKANNIDHMDIGSSFQNKYRIEELNNIKGGAKYSTFDIGSLKGSLNLKTFQGSIDVDKVQSAFSQLDIDSKYTPIDLGFTSDAKFKLDAQTSYTDVNYPEEAMTIDYENKEYHKLTLKGVYNSNSNKEPSLVNVVCFQGKLNIK